MNLRLSIPGLSYLGLFFALSVSSCASSPKAGQMAMVNGQPVPRVDLEFTGEPYRVRHLRAHPAPGGPSSGLVDAGGHITGRVCGLDIDYDVKHKGDHVFLNGVIDQRLNSQLTIRDVDGVRVITGDLGGLSGRGGVDLRLTDTEITGRSGRRRFSLTVNGDRFTGVLKWSSDQGATVEVNGYTAMRELPPADLAAILPALLTCNGREIELLAQRGLSVTFGGPPGNHPSDTSSIYLSR
jgi:hypothetical protein